MGREFEPLRGHQKIKQLQSVTAFFMPKKTLFYGQNDSGYVNRYVNQTPFVFYIVFTKMGIGENSWHQYYLLEDNISWFYCGFEKYSVLLY